MKFDDETLKRLEALELRQYAGDLSAFSTEDSTLSYQVMASPVRVTEIKEYNCDEGLHEIVITVLGNHQRLEGLRRDVIGHYTRRFRPYLKARETGKIQSPVLLSVLPTGIYVGDMEDLLNHRMGKQSNIFYPTKSLGDKVAKIEFI